MCVNFLPKVNDVSAAPEVLPMSDYPEKLRGSRSHLDDESTNYDKPPYSFTPPWVFRAAVTDSEAECTVCQWPAGGSIESASLRNGRFEFHCLSSKPHKQGDLPLFDSSQQREKRKMWKSKVLCHKGTWLPAIKLILYVYLNIRIFEWSSFLQLRKAESVYEHLLSFRHFVLCYYKYIDYILSASVERVVQSERIVCSWGSAAGCCCCGQRTCWNLFSCRNVEQLLMCFSVWRRVRKLIPEVCFFNFYTHVVINIRHVFLQHCSSVRCFSAD